MITKKSILIFIVVLFSMISISAAYERVQPKDGLIAPWHPGGYCISCHYSLTSIEKAQKISYTCSCHDYRPKGETGGYKVNMSKIFDIHKDIICIRCHIGMKDQKNVSAQDFHRIMKIECSNCHRYSNGTYQIPEKKNCSDCHASGNPHVVHARENRVGKMCIACHGEEFAKKYANKTILVGETNISIKPEVVKEYPTIADFLSKILKIIIPNGE